MVAHCHKQIREIAMAAAGELYERLMGDNQLFEIWKSQNPEATPKQLEDRFIEKNWGRCIEFARKSMVMMLTRPDISDKMKEEILDVLEKDYSLVRGRNRGMVTRH